MLIKRKENEKPNVEYNFNSTLNYIKPLYIINLELQSFISVKGRRNESHHHGHNIIEFVLLIPK